MIRAPRDRRDISILGLPLLVARWPMPMVGLAVLCAGAWLGLRGQTA